MFVETADSEVATQTLITEAGEMAPRVKSFLGKLGDLSSDPRHPLKKQCVVTHVCNPWAGKAEGGGFRGLSSS